MKKVVLAIDDSVTIRDMLTFTLENAGYTVVTAADGEDGLSKLENNTFDVIITDMNMPNINGKEFLNQLRNKPALNQNPVLVLTISKTNNIMIHEYSYNITFQSTMNYQVP